MLLNKYIEQNGFGNPINILQQKETFLLKYENILVKVLLRTINPSDILSIHGEGQYIYNHPIPRIPGFEAIGIILKSKILGYNIGDRVLIMKTGTWQTFMDLPSKFLFKLPKNITNELAVQAYINGLTAWIILTEIININPNDTIIINAGNSSIAKLFIQLSKYLNYKIIVVTSSQNYQKLYNYGADFIINTNESLKEQIIKRNIPTPNIALDAVGGSEGAKLLDIISKNGSFIIYGCLSMHNYPNNTSILLRKKQIKPKRFFLKEWENKVGILFRNAKLDQFIKFILKNKVHLPVYKIIDIENFKEALQEYEIKINSRKEGKILLSSY